MGLRILVVRSNPQYARAPRAFYIRDPAGPACGRHNVHKH